VAQSNDRPIITLTTDFGHSDHYVAAMKGVILSIAPTATIVDVAHDIAAQDVVAAAFILRQIWTSFPPETVHVAVVDPTVGTERRILAARYNGRMVVAPDNGLISFVHRDGQLEELHVVEAHQLVQGTPSPTFHGRDIMAPVAARLMTGLKLHEVGPPTDHIATLAIPQPTFHDDHSIEGSVLYVDGFGNLITNVSHRQVVDRGPNGREANVYLGDQRIGPLTHAYATVDEAEPLALIGSSDVLEIAVNGGNAAKHFDAGVGAPVFIR